ncbi:conjugal transfer protein [Actinorugispora endophytica]|uniref:Conjugative transposon protein TcpC n=1 Tax=Actinorugispora endophytica TaxID=1605990 RepID=A0A4R6V3E2_9ACTN|nr:conjugal transfer protein [Actinorugispora endophytica]TDQ54791.1 conjugative transposon protein TcpC [Actinorugispora endophytica]
MARRSTAGRGGVMETDAAADPDETFDADPRRGRSRRPRAGSGGRWWVWVGRAVLWAFILVVIFNGIWLPIRSAVAPPTTQEPVETDVVEFPETAAASLAVRFADVYLNADPEQAGERADTLAEFVPEGRATAFDLPGAQMSATGIEVLVVDIKDENNALVRLAADVNGQPMSLDVPVYADQGGTALVVSGRPALLAAPDKADLPDAPSVEGDTEARAELEPHIEGFFEAYAQNHEHLDRYLEPGAAVAALPQDAMEFGALTEVAVPAATSGSEDVRVARATVVWRLPADEGARPAELTQSYQITVVRDGGSWYVRDIQGAPNSFG